MKADVGELRWGTGKVVRYITALASVAAAFVTWKTVGAGRAAHASSRNFGRGAHDACSYCFGAPLINHSCRAVALVTQYIVATQATGKLGRNAAIEIERVDNSQVHLGMQEAPDVIYH